MTQSNILRGKIYSNFKSITKCANAAGISRNVLYNIVNNTKLPDSDEISRIGRACNLTADEIKTIFLS